MTLYKHVETPLYFNDNTTQPGKFFTASPPHPLLAFSDTSNINSPLSATDLKTCLELGDHYFCSNLIKHNTVKSSCIAALFAAGPEIIQNACTISTFPQPWHITKRDNNTFVVSLSSNTDSTLQCNSKNGLTSDRVLLPAGQSMFSVPPECSLFSHDFTLTGAQMSIAPKSTIKLTNWPDTPSFLQGLTIKDLEDNNAKLLLHGKVITSDIAKNIQIGKELAVLSPHITSWAIIGLVVYLTALTFVLTAVMTWYFRPQQPQIIQAPTPSAPPAVYVASL